MPNHHLLEVDQCREFRQTLESRTPKSIHVMLAGLVTLIVCAIAWAALTHVNLVVIAQGELKSVTPPHKVFTTVCPSIEGRVVEVHVKEGDRVEHGQLLLRLDPSKIDGEIIELVNQLETGRKELNKLDELTQLLDQRHESEKLKAEAELESAIHEVDVAERRRIAEVAEINAELTAARSHLDRIEQLRKHKAATATELIDAKTNVEKKTQQLARAELPIDEGRVEILRKSVQLVERDYRFRRGELGARRVARQGEVESANQRLTTLRQQRLETEVRAPRSGVVTTGAIHVDDILPPGQPAIEIAADHELHFEAWVQHNDIGDLRRGMSGRVKFDAFDYREFGSQPVSIGYISPDSKSPNQISTSSAYRIRLVLPENGETTESLRKRLRLGMTGNAEIVTQRRSLLVVMLGKIQQTISFN